MAECALTPVTLGTVEGTVEVAGFRYTMSRHVADAVLPRHAHAHAGFTLVVSGSLEEIYTGRRYAVGAGGLHGKPAGEPHANRYGPAGALSFLAEVLPHRAAEIRSHIGALDCTWALPHGLPNLRAMEICREYGQPDGATPLVIEALSLEVLAGVARCLRDEAPDVPPWLMRVREQLHDEFSSAVRLGELARTAGVHPVHLARAFRKHFGASPGEYLRRLRLAWARDQIVRTARPVSRIALEAGFADQSHFTRAFRGRYGVTPARLRNGVDLTGPGRGTA